MDVFQKYAHKFLPESVENVRPEYFFLSKALTQVLDKNGDIVDVYVNHYCVTYNVDENITPEFDYFLLSTPLG